MRLEFSASPTRYETVMQHYQQGMRLEFSAVPTRYEIGVFSINNKV
jgi:hypothetical protein